MAQLWEVAKLIRSKNAGPFELTFDIMFDEQSAYERVLAANVITKEWVADTYGIAADDIFLAFYDPALAVKVTIPRPVIEGDILDADVFGGQQYAPFVNLEIPD